MRLYRVLSILALLSVTFLLPIHAAGPVISVDTVPTIEWSAKQIGAHIESDATVARREPLSIVDCFMIRSLLSVLSNYSFQEYCIECNPSSTIGRD